MTTRTPASISSPLRECASVYIARPVTVVVSGHGRHTINLECTGPRLFVIFGLRLRRQRPYWREDNGESRPSPRVCNLSTLLAASRSSSTP